jgi:hypothetical protein
MGHTIQIGVVPDIKIPGKPSTKGITVKILIQLFVYNKILIWCAFHLIADSDILRLLKACIELTWTHVIYQLFITFASMQMTRNLPAPPR